LFIVIQLLGISEIVLYHIVTAIQANLIVIPISLVLIRGSLFFIFLLKKEPRINLVLFVSILLINQLSSQVLPTLDLLNHYSREDINLNYTYVKGVQNVLILIIVVMTFYRYYKTDKHLD